MALAHAVVPLLAVSAFAAFRIALMVIHQRRDELLLWRDVSEVNRALRSASHRRPLRALGGICEARGLSLALLVAWRALIVLLRGLAGHGLEEVVVLEPVRLHLVPVCVR